MDDSTINLRKDPTDGVGEPDNEGTLNLDVQGFLRTANRLQRMFAERTSKESQRMMVKELRKARARGGDSPQSEDWESKMLPVANEVFAGTAWATMVTVAPQTLDPLLIEECDRFLTGCTNTVRKYGLAAWLYDMINNANRALFIKEPSDRMPLTIRDMPTLEMTRRIRRRTDSRWDDRDDADGERIKADMAEHCRQMHLLAASTMLRWGGDEPRAHGTALMLLTQPGIGMCMLREDRMVRRLGAASGTGYRNMVRHYERLRERADREYAGRRAWGVGALGLDGDDMELLSKQIDPSCPEFVDSSWRYVYDARHLIEAYRALWDEDTALYDELLHGFEFIDGERSLEGEEPLWKDVTYLDQLACTLMGPNQSADLRRGFHERDRERFDDAVEQLEYMIEEVELIGIPLLLKAMIENSSPTPEDLLDRSDTEREAAFRAMAHTQEDMAVIALARLPHRELARRAAVPLLLGDIRAYGRIVSAWLRKECRDWLAENNPSEEWKREHHVTEGFLRFLNHDCPGDGPCDADLSVMLGICADGEADEGSDDVRGMDAARRLRG